MVNLARALYATQEEKEEDEEEEGWVEWRFKSVPYGFWKKNDNIMRYLEWLKRRLGYSTNEEW